MKLSIIIPVYNVEHYLAKCLDSVIYPGLSDYEIIVVNDGSTDSSGDIAADYARRYPELIKLIVTPNGGLGAARNVGIEAAQGDYLQFLDSDDYLAPNAVAQMLSAIDEGFDILIFDLLAINARGTVIDHYYGCDKEGKLSLETYPQLLMQYPAACNKLCRRSLFIDNNIRFPGRVWFEDLRTMPKLYLYSDKIVARHEPWYYYLQRSGSITNTSNTAKNVEIIYALDDLISYYKFHGKYEQYKTELEYTAFHHQLLTSPARVNLADPKSPVQQKLVDDFLYKFPDYKDNKYIQNVPRQRLLLTELFIQKRYRTAALLLRLNRARKGGQG